MNTICFIYFNSIFLGKSIEPHLKSFNNSREYILDQINHEFEIKEIFDIHQNKSDVMK